MFSNNFHILWICNYILSAILFITLTSSVVGFAFILLTTTTGYLVSTMIYSNVSLILNEFAILSCFITTIAIIVQIYTRNYIARNTYEEVTRQLEHLVHSKTMELKGALNIKSEFLNKLSHEIRTPLHGIIGLSSSITNVWPKLSESEKKKLINTIAESGDRLMSYTSNILDLAALKQRQFNLNIKSKIDLIEIAKTEIHNAESIIRKQNKNLTIKLELKILKPAIIECDAKRISQVFSNLLYNAIKYSSNGEVKILIDTMEDYVKVSVSDQGIGIPDNEKQKIFEPFFEGSRTKSAAEGKGLGLAMVQEIISLHQSSITVEDNRPKGTIFTFSLPYRIELVKQRAA